MDPAETPSLAPIERHTLFEDGFALFAGTLFVSLALLIYNKAGLLTGGTAGVAFVLHYATGWNFGRLFFLINLPFYWFSWRRMGHKFTVNTFIAVTLLALLSEGTPHYFGIGQIHPLYAAITGGLLLGTGCLFLARHRASLGGATIVTLYLQDQHGFRAGKVQLVIDCTILLLALLVIDLDKIAWSVLGAVAMNVFIWVNHRPGRYRAM